ncbi:MAG: LPS translocon maturation chaperone LptM [Aquincola tertiaricarbonis]
MVASTAPARRWYSRSLRSVCDMVLARIFDMNATTDSSVAARLRPVITALLCAMGLGLAGCGQKGPLELPPAPRAASGVAR